jgi:DNA-binding MarR family transcriptional regulator
LSYDGYLMVTDADLDALDRLARGAVGLTAASLVVGERADLTIAQWRGLAVVADAAPEPTRVGEVAARLGMSLPSASRLVRRLERHGLVTSMRDESDRRVTLVHATKQGLALRDTVVRHRREAMGRLLNGRTLPADLSNGLMAIASAFDGLD